MPEGILIVNDPCKSSNHFVMNAELRQALNVSEQDIDKGLTLSIFRKYNIALENEEDTY